jgi:hypothetical protein
MNRMALVLAGGVLASLVHAVPAAAIVEPTPADVQVGWKDDTHEFVRVTWTEDQPQPNVVVLRHRGGAAKLLPVYVSADGPNAVDVPAFQVRDLAWTEGETPLRFEVAVGTSAGITSPVAATEEFDATAPLPSSVVSTRMWGAGSLAVEWKPAETPVDETPGDPLDRTVPLTYQAVYQLTGAAQETPLGARTEATQITFTSPKPSFYFHVTAFNEWGGQYGGAGVSAEGVKLTATVPGWAVYQAGTPRITGTYTPVEQSRTIVLQARNSTTAPWYVVASGTFSGGKYSFPLGTGGSRQYRVAVPNASNQTGTLIMYGGYSAPASSTTQLRADAAFRYSQSFTGQLVDALLTVRPGVTTTATLQRWTGTTWTTVGPVKVTNGRGIGQVRTTTPGRTSYRYYVPTCTYGGLRFAAAYTPTFVLTTR